MIASFEGYCFAVRTNKSTRDTVASRGGMDGGRGKREISYGRKPRAASRQSPLVAPRLVEG